MNEGQRLALEQLREVEAASGGELQILKICEPHEPHQDLNVGISVDCAGFERKAGGLELRDRECFVLVIPAEFPYRPPSTLVLHQRFTFYGHVTSIDGGASLCLYYDPDRQWHPGRGIAGFLIQLVEWLEQAAAAQLDPVGAPVHPPVIASNSAPEFFVARANTPPFVGLWLGYAELDSKSVKRVELAKWHDVVPTGAGRWLAPAILLDAPFGSEFPHRVSDLIWFLNRSGVDTNTVADLLLAAAAHDTKSRPLYVVFGTRMRGAVGAHHGRQHLVVWKIDKAVANKLGRIAKQHRKLTASKAEKTVRAGAEAIASWAETAELTWCRVLEDRPEVVTPRDHASPVTWFRGRRVALWGCGATGSAIAEYLVRAGVAKLILIDKDSVIPGVLVRQNFIDTDVGEPKATALEDRLRRINPHVELEARVRDLLRPGRDAADEVGDAEVILDATASHLLAFKLEADRRSGRFLPLPIVSMGIDSMAERFMLVVCPPAYSGGTADALRKGKLAALQDLTLADFANAFWSEGGGAAFEPEPGCSAPTFIGSAAELGALSGIMLNLAGGILAQGGVTARVVLGRLPTLGAVGSAGADLTFEPDTVMVCPSTGYEIRLAVAARQAMDEVVRESTQARGPRVETGGLLFGERDDAGGVVWVTEASGPPPDSRANEAEFVCGVEGIAQAHTTKRESTRGSIGFVGVWHTHPVSSPTPSATDLQAIGEILGGPGAPPRCVLMVIVGYSATNPEMQGRLYRQCHIGHDVTTTALVKRQVLHEQLPRVGAPAPVHPVAGQAGGA